MRERERVSESILVLVLLALLALLAGGLSLAKKERFLDSLSFCRLTLTQTGKSQ